MLIELMLYSSLLITALVMAMSYAMQSHVQTASSYQKAALYTHMTVVLDQLVEDLISAPASLQVWKLITPTTHIWDNGIQDVGWKNTPAGIIRSQGTYALSEKSWTEKSIAYFHPALSYTIEHLHTVCDSTTLLCVTVHACREHLMVTRAVTLHRGSLI